MLFNIRLFNYPHVTTNIITGVVGVLLLPFLAYGTGIFWIEYQADPWIQLGANLLSLLVIILWALAHSVLIFGCLYYCKLLRIDRETEYRGCDITKHGEAAYPVTAWKESQYSEKILEKGKALPSFMEHNQTNTVTRSPEASVSATPHRPSNGGIDNIALEKLE